jgi:8-oxo-dGTP diphosphatase
MSTDREVDMQVTQVRAGGGLVIRDGCVLLVHRPQYDDWSFPKGKLEPGESWEDAAVREVEEETGLQVEAGEPVGSTFYDDRCGRAKEARYFLMATDADAAPHNEVDEVRWIALDEAPALLTYERDRDLLRDWRER